MKRFIPASLAIVFTFQFMSCNKDAIPSNNKISIIKKWNLVSDEQYQGVGVNNHLVTYTGQAADYFDFRSDGNCYTREDGELDTLQYSLISDTLILITSFGLNGTNSHISTLSANNAVISSPVLISPGGAFGRKVILTR
jgi:hypothetical protein